MRLSLAIHPVNAITLGNATILEGTSLSVDGDEFRELLMEDPQLRGVDIQVASSGEECRIGAVSDIVEPRAKDPGSGSDFPGVLGSMEVAGSGITHVLRGAAVTVVDEGTPLQGGKLLEMTGPAGERSPYSWLQHLVVVPHTVDGLERHSVLNAQKMAGLKTAIYLAQTAIDKSPAETEVLESGGPADTARQGLPRFAYIGQIHSRQRVAEVDERIFYGDNTAGMVPTLLHPNEWLDGAIIAGYQGMGTETYH